MYLRSELTELAFIFHDLLGVADRFSSLGYDWFPDDDIDRPMDFNRVILQLRG